MLGAKLHGLLCIAGVLNSEPHEIKVVVSIFSGLEITNDIQSYSEYLQRHTVVQRVFSLPGSSVGVLCVAGCFQ